MTSTAAVKPSDLPHLHDNDVDGINDQYSVMPALISDEGIAHKNRVPRFQKLDAACQLTDADDYVAVLETRYDHLTGEQIKLVWNRYLIKIKNWRDAEKACTKLTLCGLAGWRWPSVLERELLSDKSRRGPAIDPIFDSPEYGCEWTSTLLANSDGSPSECAWVVFCYGGYADCYGQNYDGFVRAVCVSQ